MIPACLVPISRRELGTSRGVSPNMRFKIPLVLFGVPAIVTAQETIQFDFDVPSIEEQLAGHFFTALFLLVLWLGLTKITDLSVEYFPWKTFRYSIPVLAALANLAAGDFLSVFYWTLFSGIWWMAWALLECRGWSKRPVHLELNR